MNKTLKIKVTDEVLVADVVLNFKEKRTRQAKIVFKEQSDYFSQAIVRNWRPSLARSPDVFNRGKRVETTAATFI